MAQGWWIGALLAAGLHGGPRSCALDVYMTEGVVTPPGMSADASRRAVAMFEQIGVNIRILIVQRVRDTDSCRVPIHVRIENGTRYKGSASALAYATPYDRSITQIHVFLDRVLPGRARNQAIAVLAHVLVHEIAHVLQGVDRHSEEGIMKAVWSKADYERMRSGHLTFTGHDLELLQGHHLCTSCAAPAADSVH